MLATANKFGISLRPMTKTHKTIEATLLQLYGSKIFEVDPKHVEETAMITVSTMGEAEFFADNGFRNILFPYPPTIDKLKRALALQKRIDKVYLSVDNLEVLENVISFARQNNTKFDLYLDLDPNEYRTGINTGDGSGIAIAKKMIESPDAVTLHGLYVHGGHSYQSSNSAQIKTVAEHERDTVLSYSKKIKASLGYDVPVLAIGSTPTLSQHPDSLQGITEMHPGNYTLYDAHQASIGSCDWSCCASTVLTRVMSKYSFPHNRLLIDAGAFALSKDRGPVHLNNYSSYGVVKDHPQLRIGSVSQEVGVVDANNGSTIDLDKYPVGKILEVIPNHSCMSCYCYEHLQIVTGNDDVVDEWTTCPRHS
eukprot:TRINITY_DN4066_c0_g1_i1.p1 TRINITY_DN4066_c0_g1~~TRINITY_DN4066_c0_g1_i1.p1  ORF type:complete len:366 (+),score=45.33 TRINITY_DN4066_c0_g1_i1:188-1285(+)